MSAGAAFTGIEMAGALLGGLQEGKALDAQARVHDENARLAILAGEEDVLQSLHDERQASGALIAEQAGSGFAVGSGTAVDLIRQNALQREIEIGNLRAQAAGQARNERQAARDARYAADSARIGGAFGALSAGLSYEMKRADDKRLREQTRREWESRMPQPRSDAGIVARDRPGQPGTRTFDTRNPFGSLNRRRRFGVVSLPTGRH